MPKKKNNLFNLELEMAGEKFKSTGETADEALANLGISWKGIKAKGIVRLSKDDKSMEHIFYIKQLRRIFANKTARLMWGKRLEVLLS